MKIKNWAALTALLVCLATPGAAGPVQPEAKPKAIPAETMLETEGMGDRSSRLLDVPEPGTLTALGAGLLVIGLLKRQRSQSR